MSDVGIELPARRHAWLANDAYQIRLTEQARRLAAEQRQVGPRHLLLVAAGMPEIAENARLSACDEGRVRFTFRYTDVSIERYRPEWDAVRGIDRDD